MMRRGWGVGPHMGAGGDHHLLAGILMIVFWVAIVTAVILLVVWIVRRSGHYHAMPAGQGPGPGPALHDTALDILNTRYAKGEIDKAEFEEKKKDLSG